jgi:DeoR/GlpR family transcriptional regulator of sugar metabolism
MKNALLLILRESGPANTRELAMTTHRSTATVLHHLSELLEQKKVTRTAGP